MGDRPHAVNLSLEIVMKLGQENVQLHGSIKRKMITGHWFEME